VRSQSHCAHSHAHPCPQLPGANTQMHEDTKSYAAVVGRRKRAHEMNNEMNWGSTACRPWGCGLCRGKGPKPWVRTRERGVAKRMRDVQTRGLAGLPGTRHPKHEAHTGLNAQSNGEPHTTAQSVGLLSITGIPSSGALRVPSAHACWAPALPPPLLPNCWCPLNTKASPAHEV
jgi:hypothetical protein